MIVRVGEEDAARRRMLLASSSKAQLGSSVSCRAVSPDWEIWATFVGLDDVWSSDRGVEGFSQTPQLVDRGQESLQDIYVACIRELGKEVRGVTFVCVVLAMYFVVSR